jgi:hypothetical protein
MLPGKEKDTVLSEKLKAVSTIRCFSKAMFSLDYGGTIGGQFSACTLDLMHAFESGVCRDVCKAFIDPIPNRYKAQLDQFVDRIFSRQRCSAKSQCLRTNFSKGITNATLLTSNEWAGLLLMYLIVAQTYQGSEILNSGRYDNDQKAAKTNAVKRERKRLVKDQRSGGRFKKKAKCLPDHIYSSDDDEIVSPLINENGDVNKDAEYVGPQCSSSEFIQLAEQLLAFHAYYSQKKTFWKEGDINGERKLHRAMAVVLQQLNDTLCRDGNGWNTAKVHSTFRHVAKLISLYGRPTNCDAEVGERGLKVWAKNPAKATNKGNSADFLRQVCLRYYESNLFAMGSQDLPLDHDCKDMPRNKEQEIKPTPGFAGKCKYRVTYKPCCINKNNETVPGVTGSEWLGSWNHNGVVELPTQILEAFTNLYFPDDQDDDISDDYSADETLRTNIVVCGYTDYVSVTGQIFRSHPNFGNRGNWNDWSIIECPNNGVDLSRNPYPDDPEVKQLPPRMGEGRPMKSEGLPSGNHKLHRKSERIISWCEQRFSHKHVPAKIIALYVDPFTGEDMALVHACRPWMQINYDRTSAITESWHLQYVRDEHLSNNPSPMRPFYTPVLASTLTENVFVVEETPGIHDSLPDSVFTGHVIYITPRIEIWPDVFL